MSSEHNVIVILSPFSGASQTPTQDIIKRPLLIHILSMWVNGERDRQKKERDTDTICESVRERYNGEQLDRKIDKRYIQHSNKSSKNNSS